MIDFDLSALPATEEQLKNCRYWLIKDYGTKQKSVDCIKFEDIDPAKPFAEASRLLRLSEVSPYLGRNCVLCEHSDEAFASMIMPNKVMWCMSCSRRFFRGNDITDYAFWRPPVTIPDDSPSLRDDAEAVMFAAGMAHLAKDIRSITSNDIDASMVADSIARLDEYLLQRTEMYYDETTKRLSWTHPEIKALESSGLTTQGYVAIIVIATAVLAGLAYWLI